MYLPARWRYTTQRVRQIPTDTHAHDLWGKCAPLQLLAIVSPTCITVRRRERAYRKAAHMNIATEQPTSQTTQGLRARDGTS